MTVNGLPVKNCLTLTKSVAVTTMLKKTFFFSWCWISQEILISRALPKGAW